MCFWLVQLVFSGTGKNTLDKGQPREGSHSLTLLHKESSDQCQACLWLEKHNSVERFHGSPCGFLEATAHIAGPGQPIVQLFSTCGL